MLASLDGHVEVVDKLLQHGATVDLQYQVYIYTILRMSIYTCNIFNTLMEY